MKKQVVFYSSVAPYVMIYKISKEFKKNGYETILCTMSEKDKFDFNFYKDAFDKILCSNFQFYKPNLIKTPIYILKRGFSLIRFIFLMKLLKPYVWFGIGRTNWQIKFTHKYLFKKYPFIYFPYDIQSHLTTRKEAIEKGMRLFEIESEKYCFEKADGIMHKGDPKELNSLDGRIFDKVILPKNIINFYPYCSKDFMVRFNKTKLSDKDKEIHLVYIGGITHGEVSMEIVSNLIREILRQKIHIHLYCKTQHLSREESYMGAISSLNSFLGNKYFHLHNSLGPKEIISEISKYDFGLWFHDLHKDKHSLDLKFSTGNKLSSYLEAGIPFIYEKRLKFIDKIMKFHGLNIEYNSKSIKNIRKKLNSLNYKKLISNVSNMRDNFCMEKNFPRLEKFVKKIVSLKK
ncbi:MAG: hypothetical protein AABX30_01570 [Nanoarchaeota archaeon]